MAKMRGPVRRRDLVLDQRVDRGRVRYPQKRFGKAHQRHALIGGKAVFRQKHLHQTGVRCGADFFDKRSRAFDNCGPCVRVEIGELNEARHKLGLAPSLVSVPASLDIDHLPPSID